jgi:type IV secretory pathway TrbD component
MADGLELVKPRKNPGSEKNRNRSKTLFSGADYVTLVLFNGQYVLCIVYIYQNWRLRGSPLFSWILRRGYPLLPMHDY